MTSDRKLEWDWYPGTVPENVVLDETAYVETTFSFYLFRSQRRRAVEYGRGASTYLGTMFDVGLTGRVKLGDYALVHGARIICDSEVTVGDYALISWNVVLMDTYRVPVDLAERRKELQMVATREPRVCMAPAEAKPIHIESSVWIGFDACVLPGVRVGEGSVIGAKSVVTQDIPPFTIAAGNPARVIREMSPEEKASYATTRRQR